MLPILLKRFRNELLVNQHAILKPRGRPIEIAYHAEMTKFEISDFIKQSKKTRSHKVDIKEKALLQYTLVGKCIKFNNRGFHTTFTLRNIIDLTSYELNFSIYSPLIVVFLVRNYRKVRYKKAHLYHLRQVEPVKSLVKYDYVISYKEIIFDL